MTRETFVELDGRKIWCAIYGEPSERPPLVCIAGGPGIGHHYLEPLTGLADRQVVLYDALGAGKSERPAIAWTAELYEREIGAVAAGLGLGRYHLFVHSAAGFAGLPHAASRPAGLAALVLSGTPANIPAHSIHVRHLLSTMGLSPTDLATFERAEREPEHRNVRHTQIVNAFMGRYTCKLRPIPPSLVEAGRTFNIAALRMMKGGWVMYTTQLAVWDFTARLADITAPTLFTYGGQDILSERSCQEIGERIPRCETHLFADSTHMPHLEEEEAHLARVAAFLAKHD